MLTEHNAVMGQPKGIPLSDTLYLVLDQGGQSSRALIFNDDGESLAQSREDQQNDQPYINFDPKWIVDSIRRAATDALNQLSPELRDSPIRAALICQRSSCLCWDQITGQPLTPLLGWQDNSGQTVIDHLSRHHREIQHISGLVPNGHSPASKWSHLLKSPTMIEASRTYRLCCGPLASYLIFHLCREHPFLIDRVNAARTQLYSIDNRDWSPTLLALFNLPRHYLPDIRPTHSRYGTIEIAGLRIPLKVVCGDQPAALFCNGWPSPNTASINLGTGAFVQMPLQVSAAERPKTPLLIAPACSNDKELLVIEGTVNGAATALNLTSLPLGLNYQASDGWRQRYQPLPLFVNGVGGLGSPDWCSVESGWQGVPPFDPKSKVLAVGESILFLIQRNLYAMRDVGIFPTNIQLSGGLSRINWLAQGLANLSSLPVHRMDEYEASAKGAAWLLSRSEHWKHSAEQIFIPASLCALRPRFNSWSLLLQGAKLAARKGS